MIDYSNDPDMLNAELIDQINWLRSHDKLMSILLRMQADRTTQHGAECAHYSMLFWLFAVGEVSGE